MQEEYLQKVRASKLRMVKIKQLVKEKKNARALKLLAKCREHGGPLSTDNHDLLNSLTCEQIVTETSYLKATIAHDLKLKRRVKDSVNNKYMFQKLSMKDLKTGINSVLYPSNQLIVPLDALFKSLLNS